MSVASLLLVWFVILSLKFKYKYIFTPLVTLCAVGMALMTLAYLPLTWIALFVLSGLIVSSVADTLLMIDEVNLMQYGIMYFLLVHILYIIGFFPYIELNSSMWIIGGCLLAIDIVMAILMRKLQLSLLIPVIIYMLVLTSMVVISFGLALPFLAFGTLLFFISDVILAINAFIKPFKYANVYTWLTYAPGQMIIAMSLFWVKHLGV